MAANVMVDLETLGTGSDAVILSIGAVKFNPTNDKIGDELYIVVDPESCTRIGMSIDAPTVLWWMRPELAEARKALADTKAIDIVPALAMLRDWYGPHELPIWGNGCMFDNAILETAYRLAGIRCPWTFRANRDYRTIAAFDAPSTLRPPTVLAHHALEDAKWQAKYLMNLMDFHELREK